MSKFLLIRHGKTRGNIEKRYIGRTDEPVCVPAEPSLMPPPHNFELFVSPMLRCRQTAEALFDGKPMRIIENLKECDFGIFEGKTADELYGCSEYSAWLESGCMADIPGGDSVLEFRRRCCGAFLEIAELGCEFNVLVTHGGVIMSILERFGYPRRGFYEYHLPNGGWILRRYKNGALLEL